MINTRTFRLLAILTIGILILGACTGAAPQSNQSGKKPLLVGWSLWPGWYPMVIAEEKGFFDAHGVDVEPVFYSVYKEQTPAMASGMIDGGGLVLGDVLLENVGNVVKVVLITDNSHGADQLIGIPTIQSDADIRGKRIGVQAGTFGELLVSEMLKSKGLSESDVFLLDVPPEDVAASLGTLIDIGHTFEPFASQARQKGNTVLFTSADAPGLIVDVIAFNRTVIEQRPEDIEAFINAWFEAVKYWQENPAQANAIIARATGIPVEEVSSDGVRLFGLSDNLDAFKQGTTTASVYYTADVELEYLIGTGVISHPIDLETLFDTSFLQK